MARAPQQWLALQARPKRAGRFGDCGRGTGSCGRGGQHECERRGRHARRERSNKVLIYAVTTGFRHESIPAAAVALAQAATTAGLSAETVGASNATNMPEPMKFSAASLAQYGAVILLANSGEPFGYPATQEIQNLIDYVKNGGALVAIENATHCYDGSIAGHPESVPYVSLVGGDFIGHPGDVAPATCTKVGTQASVLPLPATFAVSDEIYEFSQFRHGYIVVLNCVSSADTKTVRPIRGCVKRATRRYFHTALGHPDASWTNAHGSESAILPLGSRSHHPRVALGNEALARARRGYSSYAAGRDPRRATTGPDVALRDRSAVRRAA